MDSKRTTRLATLGAVVLGVAAGSYGVASAASGSSSTAATSTATTTTPSAPSTQRPWGGQRSDETLLTGDAAAKVRELALAKVSGGTVIRVETDADGNAPYEAHMDKSDGTPATVYVDKDFNVVSVDSGGPGAPAQSGTA
jgi:hypothetical protein